MKLNKYGRAYIEPARDRKECIVLKNGIPLAYDEEKKVLFIANKGFTVFPSKSRAISARWHTIESDKEAGLAEPWKEYEVVET